MRLGASIGYWGAGIDAARQLAAAQEAERLGYDAVWAAEAYGSDAATILAWIAAQTSTIGLGAGVFQVPARTPTMTAMTAATLDQLSGGRFRLGLGLSGPQVAEGWYGQRYDRPLARMRDYAAVVRTALARQRVDYQGETLQLPLPGGPGKALKLTITPRQVPVPLYFGAMGPRNLALTGELADGWLAFLLDPAHMATFRRSLDEGAARAGRHFLAGRWGDAAAAIPTELIDAVCLCGPAARVRDRLAAYRDAGVTTLIISMVAATAEEAVAQLRLAAELAA